MATLDNLTGTGSGALSLGPNGSTNPVVQVDCSAASAATGIKIKGNAAASGANLAVISSGTNENLAIDAKGSGTITLGGTSTGAIALARNTAVTGKVTGTSADAAALAIGANGATNPVLQVDASTGSVATGVKVTGAAAAGGVAIAAISSGSNEALKIDAKGTGTIELGNTSTGAIALKRATGITGAATVTAATAASLAVGPNGATNPALVVDASASSAATGVKVTAAAAASGVGIAAVSSGTNENLTVDAKGSGTVTVNPTGTGNVVAGQNLKLNKGLIGSVQSLSGAGAVNLTTLTTAVTSTGADALTLADGAAGQIKHIVMVADGGDATLTPTNFGNGSTITFDAVGDSVTLQFLGTDWWVIANNGATVA